MKLNTYLIIVPKSNLEISVMSPIIFHDVALFFSRFYLCMIVQMIKDVRFLKLLDL